MSKPSPTLELNKLLYTYGEAAQLLSTSCQSVLRLARSGELESVQVSPNQPRVTASSMLSYVERLARRRRARPRAPRPARSD